MKTGRIILSLIIMTAQTGCSGAFQIHEGITVLNNTPYTLVIEKSGELVGVLRNKGDDITIPAPNYYERPINMVLLAKAYSDPACKNYIGFAKTNFTINPQNIRVDVWEISYINFPANR